jgi:GDPmannose 4,6-dehydratase
MKRALIIGSEGQDGRILFDRLAREGCKVFGVGRTQTRSFSPLEADAPAEPHPSGAEERLGRSLALQTEAHAGSDITNRAAVTEVVKEAEPDEIYYLAAVHQSSQEQEKNEVESLQKSFDVHVKGLRNVLDAMVEHAKASRLFYAASSYIFGNPAAEMQDESTPLKPTSIYGITKAAGVEVCRLYRSQGVFASVGILYNHESGQRPETFVAQKILNSVRRIAEGSDEKLEIGDLSATVDWGYAPDYVDAMIRILRLDSPGDFIVATGEAHSVGEFVELAFAALGLDWKSHVVENRTLIGSPKPKLVGNPTRLKQMTGWRPSVSFEDMVELLVRYP